jgi:dCMP deaminase
MAYKINYAKLCFVTFLVCFYMDLTKRITKNEYYLNIAREVSKRATCLSTHFGCLIVRDDQIISTGYNGAPRKTKDCYELGNCLRRKMNIPSGQQYELCRSVHAEQNAIINAARAGVSLLGGEMYLYGEKVLGGEVSLLKAYPCFICKKMILNAGINTIIANDEYGNAVIYNVLDWTNQWAENDMIEDTEKYSTNYSDQQKAVISLVEVFESEDVLEEEEEGGCCGGGCCGR